MIGSTRNHNRYNNSGGNYNRNVNVNRSFSGR
jgi:hypothetical protein